MLITRSDDGYFGQRRSLFGVLGKAVASQFVFRSEERCLTEDGQAAAHFWKKTK